LQKYLKEVLALLGRDKRKLPGFIILFLSVSLLDLAGLSIIGPYIAVVADPQLEITAFNKIDYWIEIPKTTEFLLFYMSILLLGLFTFKAISSIWINFLIIRFSTNIQTRLRNQLMQAYQSLPYPEYLQRNSSEYIYSTQTLTGQYAGGVVQAGMKTASDGIISLVILAFLALTNLHAFLILIGLIVLFVGLYDRVFRKIIRSLGEKANQSLTRVIQGVHEGIEGLKEIRILGKEAYFHNKVATNAEKYGTYNIQSNVITTAPRFIFELVLITFVVLLIIMTVTLDQDLQKLLPTLGVFGLASIRLMPAANMFSSSLMQFRYNRDGVSKLYYDINNLQSRQNIQRTITQTKTTQFKELAIEKIYSRYPTAKENALTNLSLKIHAGESIGLIGPSGSGKTTLVDVMLGLLNPQQGVISYNGKQFNQEVVKDWRNNVAYLPQQVFLVDDSLKRNVALGVKEEEINMDRLTNALKMARLIELVGQLSSGVETTLGERGVRLSGGQRQRIALARAFYHQRNVLILDESTSALDNETEREIVEEIKRLKGRITMIVIAHRLSTIQNCDIIYRMEKGKIVKSGTPKEII
jgi:ATP-binding cassette, subfamily B, bacterial PglK